MNEVQIFEHEIFGTVRTVETNGKILFCGKDVATALGYSNPTKAVTMHCKGVSKVGIPTKGGNQKLNFISEGDIYRLVVSSKLPEAEKFETWVFDEVIPQIRKTGGYIPTVTANATPLTDEQIMAQALIIAQRTIATCNQELAATKQTLAQKDCELIKANDKIQDMEPKVDYYDTILKAENLITISSIADDYGMSGKALNALLHEWKVQYKRGDKWYLYDKYKGLGYVGNTTYDGTHKDGSPAAFSHMMWTQLGKKFINGLMKEHGYQTIAEQAEQVLLAATGEI